MTRLCFLPLLGLLLAGCGGSGAPSSHRLAVSFTWPKAKGRVIPASTNSIRVQVRQSGVLFGDVILAKPATQLNFAQLPTGSVSVTATAYPNSDATGTALAAATVASTIVADATQTVDLTMASAVDHLTVTPNPVNLALTALFTRQLTVTAYDAANAVVLIAPGEISYSTSNSLLFNVDAAGLVVGLVVGTGTVTATESTAGKSATATVKITVF